MVPRAKRLLLKILDSSKYLVEDGDVWLQPESEAKLRRRIERELNGIMVEDVLTNKEVSSGTMGMGEMGKLDMDGEVKLKNVLGKNGTEGRQTRVLYSSKMKVGSRQGYVPEGKGARGGSGEHTKFSLQSYLTLIANLRPS